MRRGSMQYLHVPIHRPLHSSMHDVATSLHNHHSKLFNKVLISLIHLDECATSQSEGCKRSVCIFACRLTPTCQFLFW